MEEGSSNVTGKVSVEEAWTRISKFNVEENSADNLSRRYDQYAELYEQDLTAVHYNSPRLTAEYLVKQNLSKTARILDVCAGTGMVGKILSGEYGYHNLDALDGSPEMLGKAKKLGIYKEFYCCFIGGGAVVPIEDDVYDSAVISGSFVKGHLKFDAMDEVIRIVKPGGYIVNVMCKNNRELEEYLDMDRVFTEKEERGEWKKIEEDTSHIYYGDLAALVEVYKVIKGKCEQHAE